MNCPPFPAPLYLFRRKRPLFFFYFLVKLELEFIGLSLLEASFAVQSRSLLILRIRRRWLAADYLFPYVHLFRFYHTSIHYVSHKMCYHSYLVETAFKAFPQFDDLVWGHNIISHNQAY